MVGGVFHVVTRLWINDSTSPIWPLRALVHRKACKSVCICANVLGKKYKTDIDIKLYTNVIYKILSCVYHFDPYTRVVECIYTWMHLYGHVFIPKIALAFQLDMFIIIVITKWIYVDVRVKLMFHLHFAIIYSSFALCWFPYGVKDTNPKHPQYKWYRIKMSPLGMVVY